MRNECGGSSWQGTVVKQEPGSARNAESHSMLSFITVGTAAALDQNRLEAPDAHLGQREVASEAAGEGFFALIGQPRSPHSTAFALSSSKGSFMRGMKQPQRTQGTQREMSLLSPFPLRVH